MIAWYYRDHDKIEEVLKRGYQVDGYRGQGKLVDIAKYVSAVTLLAIPKTHYVCKETCISCVKLF